MYNKKVGIVISSLNYGGAEKSSLILAEELNKKYQCADLISLTNNTKNLENKNINFISFNQSRVLFSIFKLYKLIKIKKYDSIITGLSHLNLIFLLLNLFLNKNNKISLILHFHNVPNVNLFNFKERIINFFIFNYIKIINYKYISIIAVSNAIKEQIIKKYKIDKNKILVIYPAINFNKIDKQKSANFPFDKNNEKIILTVGRLSKQKNHKLLIKSFAEVRKLINCRLIIIGNGKLKKKLLKLTNDLNLNNYINFIDKVDNPYPFFYNSDVFVLPSLWEGFGIVLIEALYCEMKIVSTDCPGAPKELLSIFEMTSLSKNNNCKDLTSKIIEMINKNKEKYDSKKDFITNKFSLKNYIDSYLKLINN